MRNTPPTGRLPDPPLQIRDYNDLLRYLHDLVRVLELNFKDEIAIAVDTDTAIGSVVDSVEALEPRLSAVSIRARTLDEDLTSVNLTLGSRVTSVNNRITSTRGYVDGRFTSVNSRINSTSTVLGARITSVRNYIASVSDALEDRISAVSALIGSNCCGGGLVLESGLGYILTESSAIIDRE